MEEEQEEEGEEDEAKGEVHLGGRAIFFSPHRGWKPFETWGSAPHPAPAGGLFAFLPPPLGEGVKVHPRTKRRRDQGETKGKREEGEEKEDESKGKRRG